jgi:hypothetical protein
MEKKKLKSGILREILNKSTKQQIVSNKHSGKNQIGEKDDSGLETPSTF